MPLLQSFGSHIEVSLAAYSTAFRWAIVIHRYVKGHMQEHFKETKFDDASDVGHPIALSFSDLSVWCNTCEAYVDTATDTLFRFCVSFVFVCIFSKRRQRRERRS